MRLQTGTQLSGKEAVCMVGGEDTIGFLHVSGITGGNKRHPGDSNYRFNLAMAGSRMERDRDRFNVNSPHF